MNISVFGLGYVGIVSSCCLSRDGINVIGVDVSELKVNNINGGIPPIIETGLSELLENGIKSKRIEATTDLQYALEKTNVSLISVGTPSRADGALDLTFVHRVCDDIAAYVYKTKKEHTIIIRSTIFPGTTKEIENAIKTKYEGIRIHFAFNPEFLREGTAIKDFDEAPYTIIGSHDQAAISALKQIYASVDAPFIVMKSEEAELIKYAANSWHATKIAFANEIGRIGKSFSIDSRRVMEVLVSDDKLNISKAYMKPGFAYGGSCLPKDVRAINYFAKVNNIELPLLNSLSYSNEAQIRLATEMVLAKNAKNVGMLGLAFKSGTDDLRESPAVTLAENLLAKGVILKILDHAVQESKLIGSNLDYINTKIPHLSAFIVKSAEELLKNSEVIIVTHGAAEFREILESIDPKIHVIDLTGIIKNSVDLKNYEGIAW